MTYYLSKKEIEMLEKNTEEITKRMKNGEEMALKLPEFCSTFDKKELVNKIIEMINVNKR